AGLKLLPHDVSTRAQELQRLRRAVVGHAGRPGLEKTLLNLALDPHRILRSLEHWVPTERARRPVASQLVRALSSGANLSQAGLPIRVADAQVDKTYDVYENQLVNSFYGAVSRRLARLGRTLGTPGQYSSVAGLLAPEDARVELIHLRKR